MSNLDIEGQLRKLQEVIKKNQESVSRNQTVLKPESEDPLDVEHLKEEVSEFV